MSIADNVINDVGEVTSAARYQLDRRFDLSEEMVANFYGLLEAALVNLGESLQDIQTRDVDVTIDSPGNPPDFTELRDRIPDLSAIENEILAIIAAIEAIAPPDSPDLIDVDTVEAEALPSMPANKPTITMPASPSVFSEAMPEAEDLVRPTMPATLDNILNEDPSANKPIIKPKTFNPPPGYVYHDLTLADAPTLSQATPNAPPTFTAPILAAGSGAPQVLTPATILPPAYLIPATVTPLNASDLTFNYPTFSYTETPYTSALKDKIQAYVLNVLNSGGTGVNTAVENALFNRDIERANQALADAKNKATSEWTAKGFELPDDDIIDAVARIDTEFLMKRLEVSRDILIKAWELEQANVFKSLDVAISLETQLITLANSIAQRAYDALKTGAEISLQINDMEIKRGNYKLEVFKAKLIEWEGKLKAEFAKIDIYKAQLEAQKTGLEVTRVQVEVYKVETETRLAEFEGELKAELANLELYKGYLEGVKISAEVDQGKINIYKTQTEVNIAILDAKMKSEQAKLDLYGKYLDSEKINLTVDQLNVDVFGKEVSVYQARIEAAKAAIQAKVEEFEFEKTKLEVFKGDVQTFLAKVQLKTAEYQWQQAQIAGEEAKVKLYATEIEGYKAELAGIAEKQNIGVENMKALLTYNEGLLKKQSGEVDVYKAQSEVGIQKAEVGIKGMAVEADVFKGIASAYETLGNLAVKEYDANIQEAVSKAQLQLKNVDIEISNYEKMKVLLVTTLDSTTKVLAQGVAGALSSVSATANLTAHGTASEGVDYNYSETKKLKDAV